ncbi:MAG: WD40/YVTN/BNR-like repeat-containing protein [Candidatus Binatia bacterium]
MTKITRYCRNSVAILLAVLSGFFATGCKHGGADAGIVKKLDEAGKSKGSVFPDREDYYGVFVLDDNNAWVVGNRGVVLHISDKGEKVMFLPSWVEKAIYNVDFSDPQNGIAVGQDGLIIKTSDGGQTWRKIEFVLPLEDWRPRAPHIFSLSRGADPQKIWAAGPGGTILRSQDGGETWEDLSLHRDVTLNGIAFVNDTQGWVVGEFGAILHTADGGQTWQEQQNVLNLPKYTRPDLSEEDAIKQRVPQLYLEDLFLISVAFRNEREGYVTGESGILLTTTDGGETWTNVSSGSFNILLSVVPARAHHAAVATGVLGTMAVFDGEKWNNLPEIREHVLTWLRDVSFAKDSGFGLACGGKGSILISQDGGRNWKVLDKEKLTKAAEMPGNAV